MNAKKIPVVRVGQSGATGTPEDFDRHFEKRRKGSGRVEVVRKPKLPALSNPSLQDRIADLGLNES